MEQEAVYFGGNSVIKSSLHENKVSININEVNIEEIVLLHKNHIVKIYLNTMLDTYIKIMLFYYHHV